MGGGKSKKKVLQFNLSESKKLNIYKMFNSLTKDGVPPVTREILENLWKDTLSPRMLKLMIDHLFRTSPNIQVDVLEVVYYKMVEGAANERAQILVDILGLENSISADDFQTFVLDLAESYLIILRKRNPDSFSSWVSGDTMEESDLKTVLDFFMRDLKYTDQKVTVGELRDWLNSCLFVSDILESVIKFVFNMDSEEFKPVLPRANKYSSVLSVPLVLAFSHFTYAHMKKDWRLLYSSLIDAQSWNMLCASIVKQGPTIVLIEDANGSLFGGFASQSWKICPNFYGDEYSFLFRLRPNLELYGPTSYNHNFQYLNHGASTLPNGLGMGGQLNYFTYFLSAEFGPVTVSKSSSTFRDYSPLASTSEFNFTKLEIWGIGNPDVEEENVRASGSIMDQDPGATAILEIAGKSMYSKDLKQSLDKE